MSMKPFDGDFDALTGAIFASWFSLGPKGPAAYAVGFAETTDRPWSLFYRCMRPTGATTYLGAAVDQEIAAADDFFEVFFNLLLGLNNYFVGQRWRGAAVFGNSGHRPHERQSGGGRSAELDDRGLGTLSHDRLGA